MFFETSIFLIPETPTKQVIVVSQEQQDQEQQALSKLNSQMTSLALFPQLRRTLTDVMEDELYHVPSITNASQQQQLPQQQGQQFQPPQPPQQQQQQSIMSNFHFNNSNNSLSNYKASPTLSHAKLYRNPSALNSEEMLTIPDSNNHHHHHHNYSYQSQNQELSRIPSHDMYYDIPEPLPLDEDRHIFNEFADPNLTTTNHIYRSEQQYAAHHNQPQQNNELNPHHPHHAPAKLLKFNDDLSLDYFTNEDDSKFVIYPVMSPTMIPEEIEDEELSEDDDDDNAYDNELTYLDNTIEDVKNPLNYPHQQFQAQQEESHRNEEQLIKKQEFEEQQKQQQLQQQPQQDQNLPIIKKENDEDVTQDLESDIDRMSLDSSDDEYSSNSSVIEEDSYTPSFKTQLQTPPKELKPKQKRSSSTSIPSTSPQTTTINNNNNFNNNHQCQLINPSTNQPCLKQFSRPYDLIRHQETIHASRKKIFRCVVCNKLEGGLSNKTFSRGDALSRHIRVKHGLTGTEATDALQYAKDHVEYV